KRRDAGLSYTFFCSKIADIIFPQNDKYSNKRKCFLLFHLLTKLKLSVNFQPIVLHSIFMRMCVYVCVYLNIFILYLYLNFFQIITQEQRYTSSDVILYAKMHEDVTFHYTLHVYFYCTAYFSLYFKQYIYVYAS